MRQQWRYFLLALQFFTRVPVAVADFDERELNHSVHYFPLVGLLVGAVATLAYWLAAQILPLELAVLASMLATILFTGAFHEDGLADAMDGLGGGWQREQVLAIMQDSRLGSYGAIALVLALLLKFETLSHMTAEVMLPVLVAAHGVSRLAAVLVIRTQAYVKPSGKAKPLATRLSASQLLCAAIIGLAPLLLLPLRLLPALLAVVLVWLWFSRKLQRRLGGYTGDCLGAMQQLTELAFYLGILACSSI